MQRSPMFCISEAYPSRKSFVFFSYIPTPILEIPFVYWEFRVKDRV